MPETYPKGRTTKVPMSVMPIIDVPFKRVAIDLVGPIEPRTKNGNRYILSFVDFATRYPEAVALKGIETEQVADASLDIFCRLSSKRAADRYGDTVYLRSDR